MIGRWRSHAHVVAMARIPNDHWDPLFTALADAAHHLDEEVMCTGSLTDAPTARFEALGHRMRHHAASALHDRVRAALRSHRPAPSETHTSLRPRCRCTLRSPR